MGKTRDKTLYDSDTIKEAWKTVRRPGAYSAVSGFIKNNPQFRDPAATLPVLRELETFGVHESRRRRPFKQPKIVTHFPGYILSGDLIDYNNIKYHNNQTSYILVLADIFSKVNIQVQSM